MLLLSLSLAFDRFYLGIGECGGLRSGVRLVKNVRLGFAEGSVVGGETSKECNSHYLAQHLYDVLGL